MSRHLRELVECYGQCSFGDTFEKYFGDNDYDKPRDALCGPFYSGMSATMNIPQFSMRACSPNSTSMQIEVAIKFGGDRGIVITLNNPKSSQSRFLRAFNCSWISRYKEEDERY